MVDLLIKGGKVVHSGFTSEQWVAIDGGKVVGLGQGEDFLPKAKKTIDAVGKYVLPGVVDIEHHAAQPIKESIVSETTAAVASGTTTGGIMACSGRVLDPPVNVDSGQEIPLFSESIPRFNELMKGRSMFDYFWAPEMNSPRIIRDIPKLAEKLGVTTFKLYLHTMPGEKMWDMWAVGKDRGDSYYDDGDVFWAMRAIASLGPPARLYLHCENWNIARVFKAEMEAQGRNKPVNYHERSPALTEAGMIRTWAYYANVTKCPITIMHTTTPDSLKEVLKAKGEGTDIAGNTGPHYLLLSSEWGVINVPLRKEEYFEEMWQALGTGITESVSGDNVWAVIRPREHVDKFGLKPSQTWAWPEAFLNGTSGFVLPVMLSEGVNKGRISIERLVEVCCENPARRNGLYPRKGTIQVGSDADIVIVDLNKTKKLTRDMIFNRTGWSIFEGRELKGWPVITILRGNVLMEWPEGSPNRQIVGKAIGQYIPRKLGHLLCLPD
jgi:dihydropyrimidinase/dihydroorotase